MESFISLRLTTQVQLRRGFAENVRQIKNRHLPMNFQKTAAPRRQLQRFVRSLSAYLQEVSSTENASLSVRAEPRVELLLRIKRQIGLATARRDS